MSNFLPKQIRENLGLDLASPWVILYKKLEALFIDDVEVKVLMKEDEGNCKISVVVDSSKKCKALDRILNKSYQFGNINVTVEVVENEYDDSLYVTLVNAFEGNNAVNNIECRKFSPADKDESNFIICTPRAAQYYADNNLDMYGNQNILYQDLLKEVMQEIPNVFVSTRQMIN